MDLLNSNFPTVSDNSVFGQPSHRGSSSAGVQEQQRSDVSVEKGTSGITNGTVAVAPRKRWFRTLKNNNRAGSRVFEHGFLLADCARTQCHYGAVRTVFLKSCLLRFIIERVGMGPVRLAMFTALGHDGRWAATKLFGIRHGDVPLKHMPCQQGCHGVRSIFTTWPSVWNSSCNLPDNHCGLWIVNTLARQL